MTVLHGKIAIVTGASSGIGYATAKLFAREGAKVVVTARRLAELEALVTEIEETQGRAIAIAGDIKDETLAKALVDAAFEHFGGLDIAFNNAGTVGEMRSVPDLSLAGWRETLDTNLTSAFLGAKYQVPAMIARGGGSLIFTSTFVGYTVGMPGLAAYAASKAGLIGLTQVLAAEFGAKGIRANAILPGGTDTPMGRTVVNTPEMRVFRRGNACVEALGGTRGNRALGAAFGIRCIKLRHRLCVPGRRRCIDQSDMMRAHATCGTSVTRMPQGFFSNGSERKKALAHFGQAC